MPERDTIAEGSLIGLMRRVTELVPRLVRDEVQTLRLELSAKLTAAGVGAGLIAGGAVVAFLVIGVLVGAAIAGVALSLAPWLAALIVGMALLAISVVLVVLGLRHFRKPGESQADNGMNNNGMNADRDN